MTLQISKYLNVNTKWSMINFLLQANMYEAAIDHFYFQIMHQYCACCIYNTETSNTVTLYHSGDC